MQAAHVVLMPRSSFSLQANVDDGTCRAPYNNHTFGGIFQRCSPITYTVGFFKLRTPAWRCDSYYQMNGFTGGYSCPSQYDPVLISNVSYVLEDRVEWKTEKDCDTFLFFKSCDTYTYQVVHKEGV